MEERHEYAEQRPNSNCEAAQDQEVRGSGDILTCFPNEQTHSISDNQELGPTPENMGKSGCQLDAKSEIGQNMEEENEELGIGYVICKVSENDNQIVSKFDRDDQTVDNNLLSTNKDSENLELHVEVATTSLINEGLEDNNLLSINKGNLELHVEVSTNSLINEGLEVPSEDANKNSMNPPVKDSNLNSSTEKLESVSIKRVDNSRQLGRKDKKMLRSKKKNHMLRSLVSSDRVLRSRIQERAKAPEPSNNLNHSGSGEVGKRRKKKRKRNIKETETKVDEFSTIRNRMRYLVNRMKYEQSLIDAYSSEGWKGFSSDKVKPEKELQRASSEIMRRKLKIRDLFQHLDSLCAKGRLSESLFDSEGEIDSEDIFCAKCGSEELSIENDIILCDGACDRAFHQFCLEPPLLNTDIPPDDEGWLCPGCDCKDDCIDLLNEFQGTNLSMTDSWEKVYPEAAAAAAAGQNAVNGLGLPSDDSEDDDYDPDAPEPIDQEDKSSSSESGYASAHEELEAPPNDDQFLGLPSDDSEDGDYDPQAPDLDVAVNQESSSSDFTSDSEDLAALDDNCSPKSDHPLPSAFDSTKSPRNSNGQSFQCGPSKGALHRELLALLESGPGRDGLEPVSGKRQVEQLDYKKLHDETYGSVSTDSSDETYGSTSIDSSDKRGQDISTRKSSSEKLFPPVSLNNGTNNLNLMETEHSSKRRTRQKPAAKNVKKSITKSPEDSLKSSCGRTRSSSNRRLGQPIYERLFASFQENQYPKRATKENLAQELGLSLKKVSKWFENTRWNTRHPTSADNVVKGASRTGVQLSKTTAELPKLEQESEMPSRDADDNGAQHEESPKASKMVTQRTIKQESTATKSRKRKGRGDHMAACPKDKKDPRTPAKSPKVNEINTANKAKTKRRKSV